MTPKQIREGIKRKMLANNSELLDAVTKVYLTHVKYDAQTLSCGKIVVKSATATATFVDYRFGDNGFESYTNIIQVSL